MNRIACLLLLVLLVGCGYHFPGQGSLPGGVAKLHVPLFVNKTQEPLLENEFSDAVAEVFSRNGNISLVDRYDQAEAVLEATVTSYSSSALSYDKNDDINEYRATAVVEARLRQLSDGRLLWQGTVKWDDDYLAADDKAAQEDFEQEAIEEISIRLAEELLYRMLDDF